MQDHSINPDKSSIVDMKKRGKITFYLLFMFIAAINVYEASILENSVKLITCKNYIIIH